MHASPPNSSHVASIGQALFVTFLWSTSWVLIKIGLDEIDPLTFAGLRYGIAALVLVLLWARSPSRRSELMTTSPSTRRRLALLGLVMYAITQGAQFVGLALLPAATLSLMLSLTPIIVTLMAVPLLAERTSRVQWAGMVLAAAGAAFYLAPDIGSGAVAGLLVGTVGVGANAAASLLGRSLNRDPELSPLTVTTSSMTVGASLLLAVGIAIEGMPRLTMAGWLIVTWLALVNTAGAFTLWNHTLQRLSAVQSSAINNTMLVQIAALAWIFLGESLTSAEIAALVTASVGIGLVQVRRATRRPAAFADDASPSA